MHLPHTANSCQVQNKLGFCPWSWPTHPDQAHFLLSTQNQSKPSCRAVARRMRPSHGLLHERKSILQSPSASETQPPLPQNPFQRTASNTFSSRESQPCFDEILPFHLKHLLRKRKSGTDLLTPTSTLFVITGPRWKATGLAVSHCQTRTQQ